MQTPELLAEHRKYEKDFRAENGNEFDCPEVQEIYERYMDFIADENNIQTEQSHKLALELLEMFCSMYLNKHDSEFMKIEISNEYQR